MPDVKTRKPIRQPALQADTNLAPPTAAPGLIGLDTVIEDARRAALDSDPGPEAPADYAILLERIEAANAAFPPLYRQEFVDPYAAALRQLGRTGFEQLLAQDPNRERAAGLLLDMAQAITQRADRYRIASLNAFQEVIGDLYDGFLSAEDRAGVKPPDHGVTPPLVKFGNPDFGPYTWPVDATEVFGARAAVVSLPPANAVAGLVSWTALSHETAGHDILHADDGLDTELATTVHAAVAAQYPALASYWADRIDETASDVLGILNMGPAAGIGLVAYFRGLNKAFTGQAALRRVGPASDPHPCDVLRGYLAAATVRRLSFASAAAWADAIDRETDKDASVSISLAGTAYAPVVGKATAKLVAEAITETRLASLENHALREIQDWRDLDERKVEAARRALIQAVPLPDSIDGSPVYAAHVVAAAVTEGLASSGGADELKLVTDRMISVLAALHGKNPVWGPLFVRNPGDIKRDFAYVRQLGGEAEMAEPAPEGAFASALQ